MFWKDPQTHLLQEMKELVHNCQRRVAFEDSQRLKYGLKKSEPVYVPVPGLPMQVDAPSSIDEEKAAQFTVDREEK